MLWISFIVIKRSSKGTRVFSSLEGSFNLSGFEEALILIALCNKLLISFCSLGCLIVLFGTETLNGSLCLMSFWMFISHEFPFLKK
ncbi:unnamed protein product [Moneuplotes crassus]|uniref:Uncharacterized protein n=1 Tax=Euplotes crassus TaxID=5936 RepID=A0AAD1UET6_EUPCR|nr:unnamed protein product [Moneuplotes crassus]